MKRESIMTRLFRRLVPGASPGGDGVQLAPARSLRAIFSRFWPDARPYRGFFALTLVFVALGPALQAVEIYLYKILVDDILVPRDFEPFIWLAAAYIGLNVAGGVIGFVDDYMSTWVSENFLLKLRTRVFAHLLRQSPDALDRRKLGDVLSRLSGDVNAIETFVFSGIQDGLSDGIKLIFFTGALFWIDPLLAALSLVAAPLFWLVARRFAGLIKEISRESRRRSGSLNSVAEQALGNLALVQTSNRSSDELKSYEREGKAIVDTSLASTKLDSLFAPLVNLIELIGAMVVVGAGVWTLSSGRLTLGSLLVFLTYLTQLYGPVRSLSDLINDLFSASAGAERIIELLDVEPAVADRPGAEPLAGVKGRLDFESVSYTYEGATRPAVDDVSLEVEAGQTLALVGPSGAGKSTLVKLLLRFADPQSGTVRIDGTDVRDATLESLRDTVGVLLQETLILDGSVRTNIAYGRPGAHQEDIEAAARAADAHEFISHLPHGYDTVLGSRGRSLSGGQRQRIALARLLLHDAPVLVLDEPAVGLDAASAERTLEPFKRAMADRTTVVVSHNLLTASDADVIVVLDEGRMVERGSHEELLALGGIYARLYSLHSKPRKGLKEIGA
ncbi:MAG: ABC transporter ATP-binding protein [Actinomycetota bacterium]